jgi:hypothetical protein
MVLAHEVAVEGDKSKIMNVSVPFQLAGSLEAIVAFSPGRFDSG